ncbi:hypothetical protein SDRG_04767 [Saprolegnia diclina VS20]|uniref:WRKY19-like zinc finger domain-containing protein n=1 Tax=Saprolegnia diclina (strain VS20) TaxID=1156394 RepID=T0QUN1_SAPDV|nr:hypothetical protein SDRG_04767 [Saprolegnia diclina VS20]EQC37740.1 hypothetical protein SDRG_04767 [Saprolegnia diclina VS20]|eukprot:XP_008608673.1 hypothetical protein SDRG_04767 [Saprolegnia diclina VS20]
MQAATVLPRLRLLPSLASYLAPSPTSLDGFPTLHLAPFAPNAILIPLADQLAAAKETRPADTAMLKKKCSVETCDNVARSKGRCKAHGGGQRCTVPSCPRSSQRSGLCITHGGGKQCLVDGCTSTAQSKGVCKVHGGRVACRAPGCIKNNQGGGFCRAHGGGQRCKFNGGGHCPKWAQRHSMCIAHAKMLHS